MAEAEIAWANAIASGQDNDANALRILVEIQPKILALGAAAGRIDHAIDQMRLR